MDFSIIADNAAYLLWGAYPNGPIGGLLLTLAIGALAGLAATALGILLGIALAMFRGWVGAILAFVLGFFRAIPVIMLIFWTYFLMPIAFGIEAPAIVAVICALALIYAAYIAHAVKAGIVALGQGQWQAGLSLGLNRWQVLLLIILPQALRMMVPSFINQWISLIKDSSLAYIVNVGELTYIASQLNGDSYGFYSTEIFLFIGLAYFAICSLLDFTVNRLNYRLSPAARRA